MELSLLPLAFGPCLSVASRLLHPHSIDDKTPRFTDETVLHSEGHPEKFTDLHGEEGDEDRGDQEEKRGESKAERAI